MPPHEVTDSKRISEGNLKKSNLEQLLMFTNDGIGLSHWKCGGIAVMSAVKTLVSGL